MRIREHCEHCGVKMEIINDVKKFCSDACRQAGYRERSKKIGVDPMLEKTTTEEYEDDGYTAKNIEVKEYASDVWVMAATLADEYTRSPEWIYRGLEACRLAHKPYDYFIDRYLKQLDVPQDLEVSAVSREIQRQMKW